MRFRVYEFLGRWRARLLWLFAQMPPYVRSFLQFLTYKRIGKRAQGRPVDVENRTVPGFQRCVTFQDRGVPENNQHAWPNFASLFEISCVSMDCIVSYIPIIHQTHNSGTVKDASVSVRLHSRNKTHRENGLLGGPGHCPTYILLLCCGSVADVLLHISSYDRIPIVPDRQRLRCVHRHCNNPQRPRYNSNSSNNNNNRDSDEDMKQLHDRNAYTAVSTVLLPN